MQMDPSLIGGYRTIYERKCPFEIILNHEEVARRVGHKVSTFEDLIVKILARERGHSVQEIKIELFSMSDLLFVYKSQCTPIDFAHLKH